MSEMGRLPVFGTTWLGPIAIIDEPPASRPMAVLRPRESSIFACSDMV